jgi:cell division protein FtsL
VKQKKRSFNWFIVLLVVVIGYFSYATVEQQIRLNAIAKEQAAVQIRQDEAKKINEELKKEKADLEKPEYIEKVAREELGMTKQGEMPYISSKK